MAAPSPVVRPAAKPAVRVRLMHKRPIGPTGAATATPITRPRRNKSAAIAPAPIAAYRLARHASC